MIRIKTIENFTSFLKLYLKFCLKNNYLVEEFNDNLISLEKRLWNFVNNKNDEKVDVISKYLLRIYFYEFNKYINENGKLVKKFIKYKKEVPKYVFEFEDFFINIQIIYR